MLSSEVTKWKLLNKATGRLQAYGFGLATMAALPHVSAGEKNDVYVSDALHFRRGIREFQVGGL